MSRRLGLGKYHGLSLFRYRRFIGNLLPSFNNRRELSASSPAAAAAAAKGSSWEMLNLSCRHIGNDTFVADADTVADSRTSTGRHLRISFERAAAPTSSFLCYNWSDGTTGDEGSPEVVTAHGDSVLLEINRRATNLTTCDYFVYRAGASGRLPSLSLLPTHGFSHMSLHHRHPREQILLNQITGLLRRGDDELLVVELGCGRDEASVHVLRLGSHEWEKRSPATIVAHDGSRREGGVGFPDRAIPVGDRFMCWVKYSSGILLCDMADPCLMLRSLPLPVGPREGRRDNYGPYGSYIYWEDEDDEMQNCRNMCGAGANEVRFLSVDPRCCCGGPGRSTCPHSCFAFTVTTWTMSLRTMDQKLAWVKDVVLDCEELWALPGYEGLPRVPLGCPVISPDNPDIVCFKVTDGCLVGYAKYKVWMIMVDVRKKELLSVVKCCKYPYYHLPAKLRC